MTKENAKDYIKIIEAFADGKIIEIYNINDNIWKEFKGESLCLHERIEYFRIKPYETKYQPTHAEIMTKWFREKSSFKWRKVMEYSFRGQDRYLLRKIWKTKEYFADCEMADIPPEVTE